MLLWTGCSVADIHDNTNAENVEKLRWTYDRISFGKLLGVCIITEIFL